MAKQRLDVLLVDRGLCESRNLAARWIQAGEVLVDDRLVDKPGTSVDVEAEIRVKGRSPFVSRGGEKLAKALADFAIAPQNRICLDGGISTGGFTDCLLQAGAKLVYGIDVGYGQVDWRLRNDPRVILHERTNLRHLTPEQLYGTNVVLNENDYKNLPSPLKSERVYADLAVVDVSFISLTKVLPAIWELTQSPREAVVLVKPQFEVGKSRVGKKGVVRNPDDQTNAIMQVLQSAQDIGWKYKGLTWSPITGPKGNIEYLLWLGMEGENQTFDRIAIKQIAILAMEQLQQN